jgi:hypothetical protein
MTVLGLERQASIGTVVRWREVVGKRLDIQEYVCKSLVIRQ